MHSILTRLWRRRQFLWQRYIWRRRPYALYSWRYILPSTDKALQCQRHFALRVLPELPRVVALVVVLHQLCWWYLWHAPRAISRLWRLQAQQVQTDERISKGRQLARLLRLAYSRTVHPAAYYQLALYQYPHARTFAFIFEQQLPDWHQVWQPAVSAEVQTLIRDKQVFAEKMRSAGLYIVPTLAHWPQGGQHNSLPLFATERVFCKPVAAARAEGCFQIVSGPEHYYLKTTATTLSEPAAILSFINQQLAKHCYLVQPLLRHHASLDQFSAEPEATEEAITVRLVSAFNQGEVLLLAANLEINTNKQRFHLLPITPDTGWLCDQSLQLPHWQQLLEQVRLGHNKLSTVKTLGWDFIISQQQVHCLEVNQNWGVQAMQQPGQGPLLFKYSQIYTDVKAELLKPKQ